MTGFRLLKLTASLALMVPFAAVAQTELSSFSVAGRGGVGVTFVTDYQAIGINPGNLARSGGPKFALGLGEAGVGIGSQSLTRATVRRFIEASGRTLTREEKLALARDFTSDNALNLNADATTVGFSVNFTNIGTIAFSNRQRMVGHMGLNKNAAEIMFLGREAPIYDNFDAATAPMVSQVLDKTRIQVAWLNEFNLAYGAQVINKELFHLSAGIGYRYVQGVGAVDVRVGNGKAETYTSLSPLFNVDYGSATTNPQFNLKNRLKGLQPVGTGHGVDIGVAVEAGRRLRLGLAITDLGSMQWKGNLLTAQDQQLKRVTSAGVDSYDFFPELARIFAAGTDSLLNYQPAASYRASLPTRVRAGAGLRFSENLEVGLDVVVPLNNRAGNIPAPFVGAGIEYKPFHLLRLSSGLHTGGGYGFGVPFGIALTASAFELGISTRDVSGLLSKQHPYGSIATGVLRVKLNAIR